jgi:hypothetical protein
MNNRITSIFILGLLCLSAFFPATLANSRAESRLTVTSDGLNWSDDQRITNNPDDDSFPQIWSDKDGITHIVWVRNGKFMIINLDEKGQALAPEMTLTDAWIPKQYSGQYVKSLDMDSHSNLSMIRLNNGLSYGDIIYDKFDPNGSHPVQGVDITTGLVRSPATNLAVGTNDKVYISYAYIAPGGLEKASLKIVNDQGTIVGWGDISSPAWYAMAHTFTMDSNDNVRALVDVWSGGAKGIWAVTLDKNGVQPGGVPAQFIYDPGGYGWSPMPAMAACPDGSVNLLRSSSGSGGGNLTFIKLNDKNVPVAGISKNISIANYTVDYGDLICDSNNVIHVIWTNATDNLLYYTTIKPGTESDAHPAIKLTTQPMGKESKLALDRNGKLHVTWRDNRNGNWEIYYKHMVLVDPPQLKPRITDYTVTEDSPLNITLQVLGQPVSIWDIHTNAPWLSWNTGGHIINISGLPHNGEVGTWWVLINITDDLGFFDELNLTVTVVNVPPKILTTDVKTATEEKSYSVHYTSDDDGQGVVSWHLKTSATWLDINATTGNLTGTPSNDDFGKYWVNVSVDDGNGGWASHNFTLTVFDVNDPPIITTTDVTTAVEDTPYGVQYKATDIDKVTEVFTWSLLTNATWLRFNGTTGNLTGIPTNDDVGTYWVNITVNDGRDGQDSHKFNLTVVDTNDQPLITTIDVLTAVEDTLYQVTYAATDVDHVPQVMTWYMNTSALWLRFNATSHVLSGTPTNAEVGKYWVTIMVSDGRGGSAIHSFNLTVLNLNDRPVFTSLPNLTAIVGRAYTYKAFATDADINDMLEYSLRTAPEGMTIDKTTGSLTWTPTASQYGIQKVVLEVSDKTVSVQQLFNITVFINPEITSTPTETTVKTGSQFQYQMVAIDQDIGDVLTYSMSGAPTGMTIDPATGLVSWKPGSKDIGTHNVVFKVTDKHGLTDEQSVAIVVKKKASTGTSSLLLPILLIIIILVIVIAVIAMMLRRNKGKTNQDDQPAAQDDEMDAGRTVDPDEPNAPDQEAEENNSGTEEEVEEF